MAALGLSLIAFISAIFCLWTTQDNNIYGASLAIQNVLDGTRFKGKVEHKHIALMIAGLAAVFAAFGIFSYILPIITFLSLLIPPVPGLIIAEEFFIKNSKAKKNVNPLAIISWIIAGVASYISLKANWFVPPVIGFVTSVVVYTILAKLFDDKIKMSTYIESSFDD